jgi:hypothetical protein
LLPSREKWRTVHQWQFWTNEIWRLYDELQMIGRN